MVGVKCNLCSSSEKIFLFATRDYNWLGDGPFNIVKCRKCGLVYLAPCPNAEELVKYYPDIYYADMKDENLSHKIKMVGRTCEPGKVLDIGCGKGFFLNRMKQLGWIVKGVEISTREAQFAQRHFDIDIYARITDLPFPKSYFDLVTFWHSLEHMEDPVSILRRVRELLKTGGCLFIATPNIASLQANLFRERWYHVDAPRHLNLFSAKTLKLLLGDNGFFVKRVNYFIFNHNLFGWIMSLVNLFNLNYSDLRDKKKYFLSKLLKVLLCLLMLPITFIECLLPFSGNIEILAVKEKK